jgi:predicted HTH domain antitoxin
MMNEEMYLTMASKNDEIDALVRSEIYKSREEIIADAMSALLSMRPGLRIEIAVDLYRNKKVSLWKAAEIAGLCMEEFKDLLCARSIKIEIGGTEEESLSRLARLGLL